MTSSSLQADPRLEYSLNGNQLLPPVPGPKLKVFPHHKSRIEFLGLLSNSPDDFSHSFATGSGGEGHVFRVRIKRKVYALKMFKFFNAEKDREYLNLFWNTKVDHTTYAFQSDPFFAECRAYGRIEEIQQRRKEKAKTSTVSEIAVPCYGFMGVNPTVEETLRNRFGNLRWDRPKAQYKLEPKEREPFRAIVKQLVEDPRAIVNPRKMLRDLHILRAGGVFQQDVCARNYLGGLLVDFGIAWTEPHWYLEMSNQNEVKMRKYDDLETFDYMMEEASIKTRVRASRDRETMMKLRSWDYRYAGH